jgi:hypothetical protein
MMMVVVMMMMMMMMMKDNCHMHAYANICTYVCTLMYAYQFMDRKRLMALALRLLGIISLISTHTEVPKPTAKPPINTNTYIQVDMEAS